MYAGQMPGAEHALGVGALYRRKEESRRSAPAAIFNQLAMR